MPNIMNRDASKLPVAWASAPMDIGPQHAADFADREIQPAGSADAVGVAVAAFNQQQDRDRCHRAAAHALKDQSDGQ